MLTSMMRRGLRWLKPVPQPEQPPASSRGPAVPEWSESMAELHALLWWKVKPYTMTSVERVIALCQSIAYLENHQLPGAIVECGVWKGGSMMAAALSLLAFQSTTRQLYLFDTFTGMTEPGEVDFDWAGRAARDLLQRTLPESELIQAQCALDEVKLTMMQTRYPSEKIIFVPGRVEQTLPEHAPEQIALLRLDTDWYQSTRHELEHLYPRLVDGGVLIVDDYGHWQGARKAVDEYFRNQAIPAELRTIDFTGRLLIKKSAPTLAKAAA